MMVHTRQDGPHCHLSLPPEDSCRLRRIGVCHQCLRAQQWGHLGLWTTPRFSLMNVRFNPPVRMAHTHRAGKRTEVGSTTAPPFKPKAPNAAGDLLITLGGITIAVQVVAWALQRSSKWDRDVAKLPASPEVYTIRRQPQPTLPPCRGACAHDSVFM